MTTEQRAREREEYAFKKRLYDFTWNNCKHSTGESVASWLTCWRCAMAFFESERAAARAASPLEDEPAPTTGMAETPPLTCASCGRKGPGKRSNPMRCPACGGGITPPAPAVTTPRDGERGEIRKEQGAAAPNDNSVVAVLERPLSDMKATGDRAAGESLSSAESSPLAQRDSQVPVPGEGRLPPWFVPGQWMQYVPSPGANSKDYGPPAELQIPPRSNAVFWGAKNVDIMLAHWRRIAGPTPRADWPECLCCRDLLVLCEDSDGSNLRASCRCGIWTSVADIDHALEGEAEFDLGLLLVIRVFHPWGMTATGRNFFEAVKRVVL